MSTPGGERRRELERFLQPGPSRQPAGGRVYLGGHGAADGLAQGQAAAPPLTPWVAQARPLSCLPAHRCRVGHPVPDTFRVSEAVTT